MLPNTIRLKMLLAAQDGWDTSWEVWLDFVCPSRPKSDGCCITALEG